MLFIEILKNCTRQKTKNNQRGKFSVFVYIIMVRNQDENNNNKDKEDGAVNILRIVYNFKFKILE